MFKGIFGKIKGWGVGHAIKSLDKLVPILAEKIDTSKKKITDFDSYQLAQYVVDETQSFLYDHFKLENPEKL